MSIISEVMPLLDAHSTLNSRSYLSKHTWPIWEDKKGLLVISRASKNDVLFARALLEMKLV
jgi:hypothetical protein